MPNQITNTQHSNNVAIARISSSAQPVLQDGTSAAPSLEEMVTLSNLTSSGELSPVQRCSPEILLIIFSWLHLKDINLVCKNWEKVTRERIKIVVKAKNSEKLKSALNSFRPGRESHIKFSDGFNFMPNWENIEPNVGVRSLTINKPSNLTDEKLVTLLQKFLHLKKLDLRGCDSLKFDWVDTWPILNDVKELNLSWNIKLTDKKLAALLHKFPHLEKLNLRGCRSLEFDWVDTWPALNDVKELNLYDNDKLTDQKLAALLHKFPHLEKLDFPGCWSLEFDWVDTWLTLNDVKELNLSGNDKLTDKKLAALLHKFLYLKKLELDGCDSLEFDWVDAWPTLNDVKELNLSGNDKLTVKKLAALLYKFPYLKKLNLCRCWSLEFDWVDMWPALNDVKELNLSDNDKLTDKKLAALLHKFLYLEKLNLCRCWSLEFDWVDAWPTLNDVKELNFSGNNELTDKKLAALLHKFPRLEKLDFLGCWSLEFDWMDTWPTLNDVKELNLSDNDKLTDKKLAALLHKFPHLEKLNLHGCGSLKFNSVNRWPTLNDVKELNLSGNNELTDKKLAALLHKFPYLEKLNLRDCGSLQFNSVDTWPTLENLKEIRRGGRDIFLLPEWSPF